jgi:hypothetical protein
MLEFAFKKNQEDNLVHISEVKRGLACDCVCPSCKKNLNISGYSCIVIIKQTLN